jgi:hypothetical protein
MTVFHHKGEYPDNSVINTNILSTSAITGLEAPAFIIENDSESG